MNPEATSLLVKIFAATSAAHERFAQSQLSTIEAAAAAIVKCLRDGGKVLAFGNGGSASDAQHLVAELVGRFELERRAFAAIGLTADSNVVTAISNDYGYEHVFVRQVQGLGRAGDVAFGISTSGHSPNVRAALRSANEQGLVTIALTGRKGGEIGAEAQIHINVSEESTPRIQEVHRTVLHAMCSLIDYSAANS
jgi:phosphoheptose isomerase